MGIAARIIPGILPISDYPKLLRFCRSLGTPVPQYIHSIFQPLENDSEATYRAGVKLAVKQCNELLDGGAPGLHFYTLNRVDPIREILNSLKR